MFEPSLSSQQPLLPSIQLKPISPTLTSLKALIIESLPHLIPFLSTYFKHILTLYFLSRSNMPILVATAGLGHLWAGIWCLGLLTGINYSFGLITANMYSSKNYHELGLTFQRNLVSIGIMGFVLVLTLLFTQDILVLLTIPPDLASQTRRYVLMLIPSYIAVTVFDAESYYLLALNKHRPQLNLSAFSIVMYFLLCEVFVNFLGLQLEGIAFAKNLTDCIIAGVLYGYLEFAKPCPESWFPWTRECLSGLGITLYHAVAESLSLYLEWIAYELPILLISITGNVDSVACYSVVLSLFTFYGGFELVIGVAMLKMLSVAWSNGRDNDAKGVIKTGLVASMVIGVVNLPFTWLLGTQIASIFIGSTQEIEVLQDMLQVYGIFIMLDYIVKYLSVILAVLGSSKTVSKVINTMFYGIGLPVGFGLSLWMHLEYKGILIGVGAGLLGICVCLSIMMYRMKDVWANAPKKNGSEMVTQEIALEVI